MTVTSVFHIPGQGTVLAGEIAGGVARTGRKIVIRSPTRSLSTRILGIERTDGGGLVTKAGPGVAVALQTEALDFDRLEDGISRQPEGVIEPRDLVVRATPTPWWQFW